MKIYQRFGSRNRFPLIHKEWLDNICADELNDWFLGESALKGKSYELDQWNRIDQPSFYVKELPPRPYDIEDYE